MTVTAPFAAAPPSATRARHPFLAFLIRRLLAGVAVLLVASALIFAAVQALRGDVAASVLGRNATPESLAALRADLRLDDPLPVRYLRWLTGVLRGDLGNSSVAVAQGDPHPAVWDAISGPLLNSAILAVTCVLLLVPLALALGALAAVHAGRPVDHAVSVVALVFGALPEFLVATVLVLVFFTGFGLLPPVSSIGPGQTPLDDPTALILPVLSLLLVTLSGATRMVRAGTADVLRREYVTMARLNGIPERRVLWRYGVRNALGPSVQVLAQAGLYLVGGVIVVENVFNYPGIGKELVQAVSTRDVQVICDIALILAAVYVAVNIVADLVTVWLVPALRTEA